MLTLQTQGASIMGLVTDTLKGNSAVTAINMLSTLTMLTMGAVFRISRWNRHATVGCNA